MSIDAMKQALGALESAADNECHFGAYKNAAITLRQAIDDAERKPIKFPVALRKMWTGQEVQQWLDEHVNGENHA
jgi:hypothetical protein